MIGHEKFLYLIVGAFNTTFGYCLGLFLYQTFSPQMHIVLVATITNIIAISMSFISYKLFVFKSQGVWWREYFKSYMVYGFIAIVNIFLIWFLVDVVGIVFWLSQGMLIILTVTVSYIGHRKFTFVNR